MPDFPISDEAVEAATQAFTNGSRGEDWPFKEAITRAIEAFLEAEGFEMEVTWLDAGGMPRSANGEPSHRRLVSPWKPENA